MVHRASITFFAETVDVAGPVTKFGGRPWWVSGPEWPLSRRLGSPLRFLGQIRVSDALPAGTGTPRPGEIMMAYLFLADRVVNPFSDTANARFDDGESAVVLQPGRFTGASKDAPPGGVAPGSFEPQPACWSVALMPATDPTFVPMKTYLRMGSSEWQEYLASLEGPKLGGTPLPSKNLQFPYDDPTWRLLFEAAPYALPHGLGWPSAGPLSVFINRHLTSGRILCREQ